MTHGIAGTLTTTGRTPTTHEVRIASRFNGPPKSGNGGYTVGLLARHLDGAVEVTLKRPVPLEEVMQVVTDGALATAFREEIEIASARPTILDMDVMAPVSFEEAAAARTRYAGHESHPFPNCFVCGTHRHAGDGMRLFSGPLREGLVAAPWVPNEEFANADGHVTHELIGAALDCPGAWALLDKYAIDGPVVLGRMVFESLGPVQAGDRHSVVGWAMGRDGRKLQCGTAIFRADGTPCAAAEATWIELRQ